MLSTKGCGGRERWLNALQASELILVVVMRTHSHWPAEDESSLARFDFIFLCAGLIILPTRPPEGPLDLVLVLVPARPMVVTTSVHVGVSPLQLGDNATTH